MNMEIAGINFVVSCQYPLSTDRLPGTYSQFLRNIALPGEDTTINIRIETGAMPDTGQMTKVFDTGQSWSLFRQHNEYFLSLNVPTTNSQALWIAKFKGLCEDISICCSDQLVNKEHSQTTLSTPLSYPLDQLLLMYILAEKGGALLHAAGVGINNRGCIFPGRSGAGKSTLSRLFLNRDTATMLSDDRIVIRKKNGEFRAFGTPWAGDAEIAENKSFSLSGIFFIHHAQKNMVKVMTPIAAFKRLMPVTSIPWHDEKAIQGMLAFCEDLVMNIPAYELHFRPDGEVVTFLENFIAQDKG